MRELHGRGPLVDDEAAHLARVDVLLLGVAENDEGWWWLRTERWRKSGYESSEHATCCRHKASCSPNLAGGGHDALRLAKSATHNAGIP